MTKRTYKPKLSDDEIYKHSSGGGCLFFFVVLLIAATAGSVYLFLHLDQFFPKQEETVEESAPKPAKEKELKQADVQVTPVVQEEPAPPPPPPKKSIEQMKSEADAAQAALDKEIEAARSASMGNEIPAFAGIKFGDVMEGLQFATETVDGGKDLDSGYALVLAGPTLKAPFRGFGKRPMVKVTPKTKRIFHIEFSQDIPRKPGWTLNDETTNLVAMFTAKFKQKPFALDNKEFPLGKHEFVFPRGETTLTIGEYGGTKLKLTLDHAGLRKDVKGESDELRKEALAKTVGAKALTSDKYPNGGMVKFGRVRVKNGTPKAFCGIVFGSLPPYGAKISTPKSALAAKSFYLDYHKANCEPFANFTHGRAEISSINNAVMAVRLYSEGAAEGLTDGEYFDQIKNAIERKLKAKPTKTSGEGPIAAYTYEVGDLEIVLGPDKCGGFSLSATNKTLKEHW